MKKFLSIIILLSLIFGTNNYKELNSIAIITNIGIEKKQKSYKIIFQEIIPKQENNQIKKKYRYYINESNNLIDAFNKLDEDITKEIYINHLENLIINNNDYDFIKNLDKFFPKELDNFNIIITNNNIKEVLEYNNNYNYINKIIPDNTSLRDIKKCKLENSICKIPVIHYYNNKLQFHKYIEFGDKL